MLGDSVTFGFGLDQMQSFPAELERLLDQAGGVKYEVINVGIPGFNLIDEPATRRRRGGEFFSFAIISR